MLETPIYCEAYGTVLQTNAHWPALKHTAARENLITIRVDHVSELPPCPPVIRTCELQGRTLAVIGVAPDMLLQVDECLRVSFDQAHRTLHCLTTPRADDRVVEYWMLRQILPIASLMWGDAEILHAGAVRINDEAAAFLAPSFTGKSTLVGHFVERGYTLITDDHLVLQRPEGNDDARTLVFPTIPYYRNYRAMESLGRYTERYDSSPARLRVIYVLKRAEPEAPVRIAACSKADAALELLHQAPYSLLNRMLPGVAALVRQRFAYIANLPLSVHVRRIEVPRSLDRLVEVEHHIIDDFHGLARASRSHTTQRSVERKGHANDDFSSAASRLSYFTNELTNVKQHHLSTL
jgi:hypothetical protein